MNVASTKHVIGNSESAAYELFIGEFSFEFGLQMAELGAGGSILLKSYLLGMEYRILILPLLVNSKKSVGKTRAKTSRQGGTWSCPGLPESLRGDLQPCENVVLVRDAQCLRIHHPSIITAHIALQL